MIIRNCKICNNKFETTKDKIKDNRGKFCSRKCLYESMSEKFLYNNREYTIKELSKMSGLPQSAIKQRIKKFGWSIDKAIREPIRDKHGLTTHKLYWVWHDMKQRCDNKNSIAYKDYGGRGISYCNRWIRFLNFYNDMINGYKEGLTLDRINNNKGYSKENCRWATRTQQANNRRPEKKWHWIEYDGCKRTISEWSKITGIKHHTLYMRIFEYKWTVHKALTT